MRKKKLSAAHLSDLPDKIKIFYALNLKEDYCSSSYLSDNLAELGESLKPKSISNILRSEKRTIDKKSFLGTQEFKLMTPGKKELASYIETVKKNLEVKEIVYPQNSSFSFYSDLKQLLESNNQENVMVIEPFCHRDLIEIYLHKISNQKIKLLTNTSSPDKEALWNKIKPIAKKFKSEATEFEVRQNGLIHDRCLVIGKKAWVMGQSLSAAGKKPTYLIELHEKAVDLKKIYQKIWDQSKKLL